MKTYYRITRIEETELRCKRTKEEDDHDWIIQLIRHFGGGLEISHLWAGWIGILSWVPLILTAESYPLWGGLASAAFFILSAIAGAIVNRITDNMYVEGQLPLDCVIPWWIDIASGDEEEDDD